MSQQTIQADIRGLQQAQAAMNRRIAELKPAGALGQAVKRAGLMIHRYVLGITHVDTGALRASHRIEINGTKGKIYIDPNARNPRTGAKTAAYGAVEHARGGAHAFYTRTKHEYGDEVVRAVKTYVSGAMK
ncbi:MAG: hypothetical protein KGS46_14220 [Chloroflexi bacterium]|nr:hypothetical protein [Chloroflexota bacterium]